MSNKPTASGTPSPSATRSGARTPHPTKSPKGTPRGTRSRTMSHKRKWGGGGRN
jgi:hypothetical protein